MILRNAGMVETGNTIVTRDILIEDGVIQKITEPGVIAGMADSIECGGKLLMPGMIDAHVHLREPGFEQKETILTGTQAAAAGGFTTVMPMPNLRPVPDSPETMEPYLKRLKETAVVRIEPYAAITRGEKGQEVVDMKALLSMGAAAFSDDGVGVQSDEVMRRAMEQAAALGTVIVAHTEDNMLKNAGYVHQGEYARRMGWRGIPSACESAQAERDIRLVRETGCRYHICHVSAKETVALVRKAKSEGLPVTCEVTPHHLTLIDEDVQDANGKMNPPLRGAEDRAALIQGLADGTIDIVATDHAPHTAEEKARGMEKAPFGIVGLETAFPVLYTELVKSGILSLEDLQRVTGGRPAEIFGMERRGKIAVGNPADLVLADIECEFTVDPERFCSKGRSTPYGGASVFGKILWTMVGGTIVYNG